MRSRRYEEMFSVLAAREEGAFVPFIVLGDPSLEASVAHAVALCDGGADALELGIPHSDPIADGPVIQAAASRALAAGTTVAGCLESIAAIRRARPVHPIGLLVYASLIEVVGFDHFYGAAAAAGVDSVLVADVPVFEARPYAAAAEAHGLAHVMIAPPDGDAKRIAAIAALCRGYTYVVARAGVTGADAQLRLRHAGLFEALSLHGAPPTLIGFGVSEPEHARQALAAGARGVISGSAVVDLVAAHLADEPARLGALRKFASRMKAATRLRAPLGGEP